MKPKQLKTFKYKPIPLISVKRSYNTRKLEIEKWGKIVPLSGQNLILNIF